MKYTKITHKKAIQIINGGGEGHRKLYVMDESCMGMGAAYESDDGAIMVDAPGQDEPDLILTGSTARNCSWHVGEDEDGCILEARLRGKIYWQGSILISPLSAQDILTDLNEQQTK